MKRFKLHLSYETQVKLAWWLLALSTIIYIAWMGYESVLRYDTFTATAFDLGNMDQAFWNTIHGHPFAFTNQGIDWYGPPTRLAVHFEPIILPLSVLYIFHSDPRILLIFQTLALSTGSLPVFLITRKHIPEWPLAAAVMAGSYLFSPTLVGVNLFDFHVVALVTPLLLYALLALEKRNVFWTVVTCVLASLCKEEIPAVVALLGVLVIWKYKMPRLGTVMFIGGILGSAIAFATIKQFFPGYQSNNFWYRYVALGSTPGQAIVNVLFHPWLLIFTFVTLDRIYYLANFFRNMGFLPLLSPIWMLAAIPDFAINLMSIDPLLYSGVYHYNAPIIPFVMLSSIYGLRRAINMWHCWRGEETVGAEDASAVVGASFVLPQFVSQSADMLMQGLRGLYASVTARPVIVRSVALLQPTWTSAGQVRQNRQRGFNERMSALASYVPVARLQWYVYGWIILMIGLNFVVMIAPLDALWPAHGVGAREQHIQQILNMIPPDAPVSAGDNLNPHLTDRQYITIFPQITYYRDNLTRGTVQYVVVDMNAVFPENRVSTTKELDQLITSGQFYMVARAEGVILLARRGT